MKIQGPCQCSYLVHDEALFLSSSNSEDRIDIVELLEAIAYLICQDDPINAASFYKIFSNRGVPASIFRLADTNQDGAVSVDEMMNFIMHISNPR